MQHDTTDYPLRLEGAEVPMVRFANVSKRYGALTVLDGLDLDVSAGEMVSVIGPSGSGKTTVLRVLMTLETIDGGVIYLDGEPLTHMENHGALQPSSNQYLRRIRQNIGMCFQHFNLFPHMTALENCMEGPVYSLGMARRDARERAEELLDLVGVADKKDQYPSRLSGGQQQRVAIARALAMDPAAMLFDEPTSALDPAAELVIQETIDQLKGRITLIVVAHRLSTLRACERVIGLRNGRIEVEGDLGRVARQLDYEHR